MSLLLQLNGDLPEYFPHDERRLHILACRKKQCSRKVGSIRAVREVRKHPSPDVTQTEGEKSSSNPETTAESKDLGAALFGTNSPVSKSSNPNPFSISSQPFSIPSNPFGNLPPTSSLAAKPPQPPEEPPTATFASKLESRLPLPSPNQTYQQQNHGRQNPPFPGPFPTFTLMPTMNTLPQNSPRYRRLPRQGRQPSTQKKTRLPRTGWTKTFSNPASTRPFSDSPIDWPRIQSRYFAMNGREPLYSILVSMR